MLSGPAAAASIGCLSAVLVDLLSERRTRKAVKPGESKKSDEEAKLRSPAQCPLTNDAFAQGDTKAAHVDTKSQDLAKHQKDKKELLTRDIPVEFRRNEMPQMWTTPLTLDEEALIGAKQKALAGLKSKLQNFPATNWEVVAQTYTMTKKIAAEAKAVEIKQAQRRSSMVALVNEIGTCTGSIKGGPQESSKEKIYALTKVSMSEARANFQKIKVENDEGRRSSMKALVAYIETCISADDRDKTSQQALPKEISLQPQRREKTRVQSPTRDHATNMVWGYMEAKTKAKAEAKAKAKADVKAPGLKSPKSASPSRNSPSPRSQPQSPRPASARRCSPNSRKQQTLGLSPRAGSSLPTVPPWPGSGQHQG